MFCRKCGNQLPEDSEFCPKCGTKMISESTSVQAIPTIAEKKPVAQQTLPNNAAVPKKIGGLQSVVRIGRNVLGGFAVLLTLFSFLGLVGLIIGAVVVGILVLVGWRMSVAKEREEEDNAK